MRSLRLDGKIVVVTGATQGLGERIARDAAAQGAAGVTITGRNAKRGEAVASDISKTAPCLFVPAELGDEAQVRAVMAKTEAKFGRIDGLVNSGALTDRGTIENTSVELWDRLFAVNVRAPFILTQEFVRRAKARGGGGSIVNVITRSAHGGQPFLTAYSSSKGALATLTKNVANAVRFDKIRVNGMNIGWMETPGEHAIQARDGNPPDWLAKAAPHQPFGRILSTDDVSTLAVFLLSDASEMMTGSVIDFDQNPMGGYD
jgi:NAD(P)-dependent dehydrogenase (short-subunit alcohol dehydrogenase family)